VGAARRHSHIVSHYARLSRRASAESGEERLADQLSLTTARFAVAQLRAIALAYRCSLSAGPSHGLELPSRPHAGHAPCRTEPLNML